MGYVYLLESTNEDGTVYKIGYTKGDVKERVKTLQTGNSFKIKEVYSYHTKHGQKLERTIHNRYSYRRMKGEWFNLSLNEVTSFISTCDTIEKNFDMLHQFKKDNYPF